LWSLGYLIYLGNIFSVIIPVTSPALVIDQQRVRDSIQQVNYLREQSACQVLYSIKALPLLNMLKTLQPFVDGFSVSSLFEAKLAAEVLMPTQSIHLTTPGIRPDEVSELADVCTHISFNSLTQRQLFSNHQQAPISTGLRINPHLSFAPDLRFDPCRLHSKLGINSEQISQATLEGISGLHIHTVFSQCDYQSLLETLAKLEKRLGRYFSQLQWLNLGGGYLFKKIDDHEVFIECVSKLRQAYDLDVYIEPGKAIVGDVISLVSTVIDCFASDGKMIVVLDTSVNHNPEVFEYQRQPKILQSNEQGRYAAILVGSTCLAGDIFGEYKFIQPVKVGDKISFPELGAYTLVKANRFNGYNYPDIYSLDAGELTLIKQYSYDNYHKQWES